MKRMRRIEWAVYILTALYQVGSLAVILVGTGGELSYAKWTEVEGVLYYSPEKYQAAGPLLAGLAVTLLAETAVVLWGIHMRSGLAGCAAVFGMLLYHGMLLQAFYNGGENLKRHIFFAAAGFFCMILYYFLCRVRLDDRKLRWVIGGTAALIAVQLFCLLAGVVSGDGINGSYAWLSFAGVTVQPGESLKVAVILLSACCYKIRINRRLSYIYMALCGGSAVVLAACRDLGNAAVLVILLVVSSYFLFDDWMVSAEIFLAAAIGVVASVICVPYVRARFFQCFHALDSGTGQHYQSVMAIVRGGLKGMGAGGDTVSATWVTSSSTDFGVNVLTAIFGVPVLILLAGLLILLLVQLLWTPVLSPFHYMMGLLSAVVLFAQYVLHMGGGLDILPFTGICASFISQGGSNMISSFLLWGGVLVSFSPAFEKLRKEKEYDT